MTHILSLIVGGYNIRYRVSETVVNALRDAIVTGDGFMFVTEDGHRVGLPAKEVLLFEAMEEDAWKRLQSGPNGGFAPHPRFGI